MTTKEMLRAEIEKLPEAKLNVLLQVARGLADSEKSEPQPKLGGSSGLCVGRGWLKRVVCVDARQRSVSKDSGYRGAVAGDRCGAGARWR